MTVTYSDAGVDLDVAEAVSEHFSRRLGTGLFGGFVPVSSLKRYDEPVLVSSIDGVGTKVRLAAELGDVSYLGHDIVHHCVNDIAVHGAEPLFFLDYLAFNRLDPETVDLIVGSIKEACRDLGVALAGGETAEMPLVYPDGRFDIAGAVVGVVERAQVVDGTSIRPGDVLIGFASSGLHTNGYSLVQKLFTRRDYDEVVPGLESNLGAVLLEPHCCYLRQIRSLRTTGFVHGLAHITGGGIAGNLGRIVPEGMRAVLDLPEPPALFAHIESRGVPREEMTRVFNMGIGLIAVCDPRILESAPIHSELAPTVIGLIEIAQGATQNAERKTQSKVVIRDD